jgi:D-alanine-D-alanine ligase
MGTPKQLRILVITNQEYEHSSRQSDFKGKPIVEWKSEFDVTNALHALGHETQVLAGFDEVADIRFALNKYEPHIVFNLLEEFRGEGLYVPYILGYVELKRVSFTGCNPYGLVVCDNKTLCKKILRHHRIPVPDFAVFERGRAPRRLPRRLEFPVFVKSASMHGSVGISQASVVTNDEKLKERVEFIHDHTQTDAVVEQYIEGRELYVGVMGNRRAETFPVWEMTFGNLPQGTRAIATGKVKWDPDYQEKLDIETGPAGKLPDGIEDTLKRHSRKAYKMLGMSGYARMDFRLTEEGRLYLLECNPNPDLNSDEDFAMSADATGLEYEDLIKRIVNLGISYSNGQLNGA